MPALSKNSGVNVCDEVGEKPWRLSSQYATSPPYRPRRAAHRNGWETVECTVYGKTVTKLYKTFLATYRPVGGVIRVVIVEEDRDYRPLVQMCRDPHRRGFQGARE